MKPVQDAGKPSLGLSVLAGAGLFLAFAALMLVSAGFAASKFIYVDF